MSLREIFVNTMGKKEVKEEVKEEIKVFNVEEMNRITNAKNQVTKVCNNNRTDRFNDIMEKQKEYKDSIPINLGNGTMCPFCSCRLIATPLNDTWKKDDIVTYNTYFTCRCGYEYAYKDYPVFCLK